MTKSTRVADLMRQWRRLAGLNTADAGRRLGLSGRAIEDIEQGRRRDGDELTRIALLALIGKKKGQCPTSSPQSPTSAASSGASTSAT